MSELWCEEHDHFKRTCPWCEIEELQVHLNQAIEALEEIIEESHKSLDTRYRIDNMRNTADITLQSIKGGEYDATQTSD